MCERVSQSVYVSVIMENFDVFEKYFIFRLFPLYPGQGDPYRYLYDSLLCGAVAGIAAKTVIAPAERIKISFQVTAKKFTLQNAFLEGRNIVKSDGVLSLWRGHSTTILRVAPYSGISYACHDFSEQMFKQMLHMDVLPPAYKFLAGSLGGVGGTVLTYPLDVLRVRLALGNSWSEAIKQGGMFQGLLPTLLGIIPYAGTAWLTKQTMLEYYRTINGRKPSVFESVLINALAGLVLFPPFPSPFLHSSLDNASFFSHRLFGQFVSYPLDIVRRRMQISRALDGQSHMTLR